MAGTHVLITGGAGFIGSHLAEALVRRGDHVTVLDDLSTGQRMNLRSIAEHDRFHFVQGSVLDQVLVHKLVQQAEVVYHLAAAVGVEVILRLPLRSLEINIRGTEHVLAACAASTPPRRVMIASTSEVYGKNDKRGLIEDDDRVLGASRLSRWFYAAAKSIDEALAVAYWQEYQLPVVIARFFNVIGPRQSDRYGMVVPRFVRQALSSEPLTVFGDGQQTRCFTNVLDAVQALLLLMNSPQAAGEAFNIGTSEEIRVIDLARRIIDLVGSRSKIKLIPYDHLEAFGKLAIDYEDMRRRVPDTSKLYRLTGFCARIPLEDTLRQVVDYQRSLMAQGTN